MYGAIKKSKIDAVPGGRYIADAKYVNEYGKKTGRNFLGKNIRDPEDQGAHKSNQQGIKYNPDPVKI